MYLVSIGALRPRGFLSLLRVVRLSSRALKAARVSPGCVSASVFRAGGQYFALSVWDGPAQMQAYARGPVHGPIMRNNRALLASFKSVSYPADHIPSQAEASAHWFAVTAPR